MHSGPPLPETQPEATPRPSWRAVTWRWSRRGLAVLVALLAALVVSFFTLDLGAVFPQARTAAEGWLSRSWLDRPTHIGRISARVSPGHFVIEDLVIEGRTPTDPPFFAAKRIDVRIPWWTMFRRQVHVQIELSDWRMTVESWEGGLHNIPRLKGPPRPPSTRKNPFVVTVDWVYARRGAFVYEDHAQPWGITAPNLEFQLVRAPNLQQYVGTASFEQGAVHILRYRPMRTDVRLRFELNGALVKLKHLDLLTDGSRSHVNGNVDFSRWPEQAYNVSSTVDFPQMKEIFFAKEPWRLKGTGDFDGVFRISKEGRELAGQFRSTAPAVNDLEFPDLHGDLVWTASQFAVTHADARFLGGRTRFSYTLAPLGTKTGALAAFEAEYRDVDLFDLDRLMGLRGLRLAGVASGSLEMQWPNGHFGTGRTGRGHTVLTPPADVALAPQDLPAAPLPPAPEPEPFESTRRTGPLALGADLRYAIEPGGLVFEPGWAATPLTHIAFQGRMANAGESQLQFDVTSHDWQESDRLLVSIMTAVSGPTGAVEVGGRGTFHGAMTGSFSNPRVAGRFVSHGTRAWGVTWGEAVADVVIQGGYVDVANSRITQADGVIEADGHYALGFRKDDREEIRARVSLSGWPVSDLRHAFALDDWPMDGTLAQASLDLSGQYRSMFGRGTLRIERGTAWGETFAWATGDVVLEGTGLRVQDIDLRKTAEGAGRVRAEARVGWDGTYSFQASGAGVPVETLDNFRLEKTPLSGQLRFEASGEGLFESPDYKFEGEVPDLFIADEGIGPVTGRIHVYNNGMDVERMYLGSSRLDVLLNGRVAFDSLYSSALTVRVQRAELHPYLKFVLGDDVSPYTRMVVGGVLNVRGPLTRPESLSLDTTIDQAQLTLFDYELRQQEPIRVTLDGGALAIESLKLQGDGTNLQVSGGADTKRRIWDLRALGDANLSVLQAFKQLQGITASGVASVDASLRGDFDAPEVLGTAVLADGRLRPLDSPHSLEHVNGRIVFGQDAVELRDMTGRIGNGDVDLGGSIRREGYRLTEYNLTAQGRSMRLRYPDGFNSTVNMRLALTGPLTQPKLSGDVDVLRVAYLGQGDASAGLLGFAAFTGAPSPLIASPLAVAGTSTALGLDIRITAPRMTIIDTNIARVEGSADLLVGGTFERPLVTGAVQIAGGQVLYNGNRYYVREGTIDFRDPETFEPEFDILAETRPRVAGQTFLIGVHIRGTFRSLRPELTSDPWLPESEVLTLLLGGTPEVSAVEQRALLSSQEQQQRMLQTAGAVLLMSPLTQRVGSVFERFGAVDTVQITPVLNNETAFQQLNPSARVTLLKRISPRAVLTYSRTLSGPEEELILLEYDQNDRWSWVLSRNEDRSFALDFRIRYLF